MFPRLVTKHATGEHPVAQAEMARRETLEETGASANDLEGMVNYPLSITGVEMAAFFRQEEGGFFRVSLRSQDLHDVSAVARLLDGGGHKNAAGLSVQGDLEEARAKVMGELEKLLGS